MNFSINKKRKIKMCIRDRIKSRRRQTKEKATPIFAGLVKCADCGWSDVYKRQT